MPDWKAFQALYKEATPADKRLPSPGLLATNYYDATMAMYEALNKVKGDLGANQDNLKKALAGLDIDAPNGDIKLDANRQAIGTNFVTEVVEDGQGGLVSKVVKVVPNVNQTLGYDPAVFAKIGLPGRTSAGVQEVLITAPAGAVAAPAVPAEPARSPRFGDNALALSTRMLNPAAQTSKAFRGRGSMSRALAVFHGRFGRATVYQLNRPFSTHAHREGHLIFQVGGTPGHIRVGEETHRLDEDDGGRRQPLGAAQFPADRRRRRRAVLRALCQCRLVRAAAGPRCVRAQPHRPHAGDRPACAAGGGDGLRRAFAGRARRRIARADRRLSRGELGAARAAGGLGARGGHRFPRPQIDQAAVGRARARRSNSTPSRARRGSRGRISTSCSAPRPASRPTSISTRC